MNDAGTPEPAEDTTETETPDGQPDDSAEAAQLAAYDLDHDGKISLVEDARARLGIVDAHMEEVADQGGLKGKLANVAHKILDKVDNDDQPSTSDD